LPLRFPRIEMAFGSGKTSGPVLTKTGDETEDSISIAAKTK
jgi:hypothetical protein